MSAEPIAPITLPPLTEPNVEGEWLRQALQKWLDEEYLPEPSNIKIAQRAKEIYVLNVIFLANNIVLVKNTFVND